MEAVAVIAEFNPFHNGHALFFNRIDQIVGPEGAKAVFMSGCFTQRGEPALLDKWTRTRTALLCGADLVVELPFAYAAASAGRFAAGGVALASATGVCRHIAFGSETADLDTLRATAEILSDEPAGFRARLRAHLDLGKPFAGARIAALEDYMRDTSGSPKAGAVSPDAACLRSSNNILAVEYLMAIRRQIAGLEPHVILREGAGYRSSAVDSMLPSATSIRAATRRYAKDPATLAGILRSGMPVPSLALLVSDMLSGAGPVFPDDLSALVIGMLRAQSQEVLERFAGMEEGLAARFAESASRLAVLRRQEVLQEGVVKPGLVESLLSAAATRRFASTRLRRALASMLVGMTRDDLAAFDAADSGPRYLRILGFNRKGRYLLNIMRRRASLPIIMNASDFLEHGGDPVLSRMSSLDLSATDIWMLARGKPCGIDFDTPPVMV